MCDLEYDLEKHVLNKSCKVIIVIAEITAIRRGDPSWQSSDANLFPYCVNLVWRGRPTYILILYYSASWPSYIVMNEWVNGWLVVVGDSSSVSWDVQKTDWRSPADDSPTRLHSCHWRPSHMLGCSVFTPKQVFGPRTAKSQLLWIKFCIHLLLYGIYLWADLDCVQHVGGSRPNQNDFVFL